MERTAADAANGGGKSPKGFLNLPQDIRFKIYNYAFTPYVAFTLTQREHVMKKQPRNWKENHCTAGVCLPSRDWQARRPWRPEDDWDHHDPNEKAAGEEKYDSDENNDDSWTDLSGRFTKGPQRIPTLAFRVSTYSPLLLVSKQVSSEVSGWVESSGLQRSVHTTIRKCVFGDTVIPSRAPDFLRLVEHSRLIIAVQAEYSISFLQRLPHGVRAHIHSVVLTRLATLWDDGPTRRAWNKQRTDRYAEYTKALHQTLPGLREIAMHIPLSWGRDAFCTAAPSELADMLQDGMVDTVRLLYLESHGHRLLEGDIVETLQATQCLACGKRQSWMETGTLKRCARCLKVLYCSQACQKVDWRSHKAWCTQASASEKTKPQQDPWLPRFDAVLEEHIDEDSGKFLVQTAEFPRNNWADHKTVIALRRRCVS